MSDKFINLCKNFYNYASMAIRNTEGLTDFVKITKGVLQGETLSAGLFLIFINDLIEFLTLYDLKGCKLNNNLKIQALGYADDFVLFATSYQEMLLKIKVIKQYCVLNALKINTNKSKILIFHKGNINYKKYRFCYKNEKIEIVRSFNYLGVEFSTSGLFNKHLKKIASAANLAMSSTVTTLRKNKIGNWKAIEQIYKSLVYNVTTYCSKIWAIESLEFFDNMQANFYKKTIMASQILSIISSKS